MSAIDKQNEGDQNRSHFPVTECSQRYSVISFEMVSSFFKDIISLFKNCYWQSLLSGGDIDGFKKNLKKEWNRQIAIIEHIFTRLKRPYILELLNLSSMTRVHQSLNAALCESYRLELNAERRVVLFEELKQPKAIEQEDLSLSARLKRKRGAEIESVVHARKEDFEHLTDQEKDLLESLKSFMLSASDEDYEKLKAALMNAPAAECARLGTWGALDVLHAGNKEEQPKLKEKGKEKEEVSEKTKRKRVIKALYKEMGWESLSPSEQGMLFRMKDYMIEAPAEEFRKMNAFLETCTIKRCLEVARTIDRRETMMEIAEYQNESSSSAQDQEILFVQQQESIKRREERLSANQPNLLLEVDEKIQVVENPIDELEQAIQYSLELEQTSPKPPVLLTTVTKKKTRKIQSVEVRRRKEPKIAQKCTEIEKTTVAQEQQYKDIATTLETFMRVYMGIDDKSMMLEPKNLQKAIDKIFGVQNRTRGSHKQYNQKDVRGDLQERLTYASHGAKDKVKPGTGQKILRTLITIPVLPAEEKEVRGWNQKMWGIELYDPTLEASIHGAKGNVKGQRMSRSEESAKQDSTPTPKSKRKKNCSQKR